MTERNKALLVTILTSFAFWIPIWLPFIESKGISIGTAFTIIAIYSAAVILLEYPTGVIGDTYSHKFSVSLGFLIMAVANVFLAFASGVISLTFGVLVLAVGTTLISGSDQAYYHSLFGESYRKEYRFLKNAGMVATIIGITLGSWFFTLAPILPLIANGLVIAIAFYIFSTMPEEESPKSSVPQEVNPFVTAKSGIKLLLTNRVLQYILVVHAITFAFTNNLKWLHGNVLTLIKLPVEFWGLMIAVFYFGGLLGVTLHKKFEGLFSNTLILATVTILILSLGFSTHVLILPVVVFLIALLLNIVSTTIDLEIQESTPSSIRASVLSLKSLIGRAAAALYVTIIGILARPNSLLFIALATTTFFIIATWYFYRYIKSKATTDTVSG